LVLTLFSAQQGAPGDAKKWSARALMLCFLSDDLDQWAFMVFGKDLFLSMDDCATVNEQKTLLLR
jgi:hypothetical protein